MIETLSCLSIFELLSTCLPTSYSDFLIFITFLNYSDSCSNVIIGKNTVNRR